MRLNFVFVLFGLLVLHPALLAQYTPAYLPGTEILSLHSNIINQDFELSVKLPWSYEDSDTIYPVLFTTDANRTFPIYSTLSHIYETPGAGSQEVIIVGIGYKVNKDRIIGLSEWALFRNRDLRPTRSMVSEKFWKERLSPVLGAEYYFPKSGGGADFLKFIQDELIPFIEENYRVSKTDRGIAGYSLGGLFALYALFHAPETFNRYFAGSPSLIEQCIKYEAEYADNHDKLKANILITANESEKQLQNEVQILMDSLLLRNYSGVTLETYVFKDENHISGGAAAISRALRVLYYNK